MITLILLSSCKEEIAFVDPQASDLEKAYFEDYQIPLLKWGFIDPFGKFQIPPIYDDVRYFSNGIACANKRGRWGVIDTNNNVVIDFQYLNIQDFSEGKALVQDFDHKRFYIDQKGEKVIECPYDECYSFKNNRARYKDNEVYGFLDKKGKSIANMRYTYATNFTDGFAVVGVGKLFGVIDTSGNLVIEIDFDKIKISDGIALLKKQHVFSYFDLLNNQPIPGKFLKAQPFKDGIAIVATDQGLGFIDKNGIYSGLNGDKAIYLNDKRIGLRTKKGYSIIRLDKSPINNMFYDNVFKFYCGIAGMERNGLWGYVDLEGKEVLKPQLPLIWDCSNDRIRVINPSGFSYYNLEMENVIPPQFIESRDFKEGLAPAQATTID